jgi:hypothetical protein
MKAPVHAEMPSKEAGSFSEIEIAMATHGP